MLTYNEYRLPFGERSEPVIASEASPLLRVKRARRPAGGHRRFTIRNLKELSVVRGKPFAPEDSISFGPHARQVLTWDPRRLVRSSWLSFGPTG